MFLEAVGAQPRDRRVYGLGTRASAYFPDQASSSRFSGDIPAERLEDIRRSITEDVRQEFDQRTGVLQQEFDQRTETLQHELADVREQMRQMQDFFSRMSQGFQPPRDPDAGDS